MWACCLAVKVCSQCCENILLEARQDGKSCNCHELSSNDCWPVSKLQVCKGGDSARECQRGFVGFGNKMLSYKQVLNPAQKLNFDLNNNIQKKNGFTLFCIVGYRRPAWAPFAALVPNPWFTVYICAQMYTEGHNAKLLRENQSLNVREPKKEKKTSLQGISRNTALPSVTLQNYQHTSDKHLGACYVFLIVGTYKALQ